MPQPERPRDAPDRVWTVRQVMPATGDLPAWKARQWQPSTYVREYRKRDRLHVWKLDAPLTPGTYMSEADAEYAGHQYADGVPHDPNARLYALALRLSDLFPTDEERARVRLGEGWRYILAIREGTTARRGRVYSTAICTHNARNLQTLHNHVVAPEHDDGVTVTFVRTCGRVNHDQHGQLVTFTQAYGLYVLPVTNIPKQHGSIIQPNAFKHD